MRDRRFVACSIPFLLLLGGASAACGDSKPTVAPDHRRTVEAAWSDVFDKTPDLYVAIRPLAIKRDGVYGALFKSLVRAAQARANARGETMAQAVEDAQEIVLGLDKGGDVALVLRGVPASLDPERIMGAAGEPLFRATGERGKVAEYDLLGRDPSEAGSLFVLPGRVWVGALGPARARARQAFATPANRPAQALEPGALAAARVSGPLVHALDRDPMFGPVTNRLTTATFALAPGKEGLVVRLVYADSAAAAQAESEAKRSVAELAKQPKTAWLKDAKIAYEGSTLVVRIALPPRLLEELPRATGADLGT
jgi:hypothetical protein